ncbi:FAD-dependent oxidoreductase [Nocardia rhamnosiphila]|uniref:NAD(P)/FAD-dependent oxidoreductase n=1 Tax=Nocardia rhamnosiphila TaxID=426716 RepID=UPI0033D07C01
MTDAQDSSEAKAPVPQSVVVIGASHAGVQLADRLRAEGYTGEITLISHECHLPYQRPPLSKAWLKGEASSESVLLRDPAYYADQKIELLTGTRVEQLERVRDGVQVRFARDGERRTRQFDRLVLATGARARRLTLPGADHPDVLVLRDIDHARSLAGRVQAGPIVVVGGGFVGLEVAATARTLGAAVTVIEAGERLLARAVGPDTASTLLAAHRGMGTEVLLGTAPAEILHDHGGLRAVRIAGGREIPAATVLVGIGAQARTELAEQLGLECDGGVVVDEACRTSDGWTLAIGDCTTHVSDAGNRYRLESVDNAMEQAHTAAAVLLGRAIPKRTAPWFWSDQGDQKLQITGLIGGHTSMLVRVDPERPRRRVALYFSGGALVAAECLNSPADFVVLRAALARDHRPGPEALSDTGVPLKKLLGPSRG